MVQSVHISTTWQSPVQYIYISTSDLSLCLVMAVAPSAIDGYCSLGRVRLVPIWRPPRSLASTPPGFQASGYRHRVTSERALLGKAGRMVPAASESHNWTSTLRVGQRGPEEGLILPSCPPIT